MPFTIFVCYYKEDSDVALPLIERLSREFPDAKIWSNYDDFQYKNKMDVILQSDVVVYPCSDESHKSIECAGMMNLAIYNEKVVMPYIIYGRSGDYLKQVLERKLNHTNFVHSENEPQVESMIQDIKQRHEKWKATPRDEKTHLLNTSPVLEIVNCYPELLKEILTDSFNEKYLKVRDDHEGIDLGLPSGLLWSSCNLGAKNPEDRGYYYAWGEEKPKPYYSEKNCDTFGKSAECLSPTGAVLTDRFIPILRDTAHCEWGEYWRMPAMEEVQELIDNTVSIWTTCNGVEGRMMISKKNKSHIFFPASGHRHDLYLSDQGVKGFYWTANMDKDQPENAGCFSFDSEDFVLGWKLRQYGFTIRPVSD